MKAYVEAAPRVLAHLQTDGWHNMREIVRATGVSRATVIRTVTWLRERHIEIEARHGDGYRVDPRQLLLTVLVAARSVPISYTPESIALGLGLDAEAVRLALALTVLPR